MKTERIVLAFIAVVIGILVAGVAFYLYQATKVLPTPKDKTIAVTKTVPTKSAEPDIFITLDSPKDEEVVTKKTVIVSGKTSADATVIISSSTEDTAVTPTSTGTFSSSITIQDGQNEIYVIAISPTGEEVKTKRTITYSTESF